MGIHEKICQLLVPIRTPTLFSLQQAGRVEMQLKKVRMYERHWNHIWKTMKHTVQHMHLVLSLSLVYISHT